MSLAETLQPFRKSVYEYVSTVTEKAKDTDTVERARELLTYYTGKVGNLDMETAKKLLGNIKAWGDIGSRIELEINDPGITPEVLRAMNQMVAAKLWASDEGFEIHHLFPASRGISPIAYAPVKPTSQVGTTSITRIEIYPETSDRAWRIAPRALLSKLEEDMTAGFSRAGDRNHLRKKADN